MDTVDTVLVPTDGSDHARRAAEHGDALARALDASLHLLNVVDLRTEAGPFDAGGLRDEVRERLREDGERTIEETTVVLETPDSVETSVVEGDPVEDILAYVGDHGVDLVVIGTQGRTGLDRYLTGSVAEGVVRHADVPVLTVSETGWGTGVGPYDDVLLATDGSEYADAAVEPAVEVAAAFDATVHVHHVVDARNAAASGGYNPPSEVIEELREGGEEIVDRVASRVREAGPEVTTGVDQGVPAESLLEYAQESSIDAIAMGTAGRTGLDRFLLGSTTERVIRHADVPVLAVNATGEGE